jgi:peptidoglycan/xylan/chitin deacetylase (PgdA/CDA1 family)
MNQQFFDVSFALRLDRLFASINRARPIVLVFHGVTAEAPGSIYNYEGSHLYTPVFRRLVERLSERYRFVSLDQIVDWLERRTPLPERALAITFDDGYRNVLTQAAPILHDMGAPATVFVATDFVAGGRMLWPDRLIGALASTTKTSLALTWNGTKTAFPVGGDTEKIHTSERIRALCKSLPDDRRNELVDRVVELLGVDEVDTADTWDDFRPLDADDMKRLLELRITIGSHTCSHPIVAQCTPEKMRGELTRSKRIIEDMTGAPCTAFGYPNGGPGDFNADTRREVAAAGYRCAVTTIKERVAADQDPYEIPRYSLTHNKITDAEFLVEVSGFPTFLRGIKRKK